MADVLVDVLLGVLVDVVPDVVLNVVVDVVAGVLVDVLLGVLADVLVVKLDSVWERLVAEVTDFVVMSDVGFMDSLEVEYDIGFVTV